MAFAYRELIAGEEGRPSTAASPALGGNTRTGALYLKEAGQEESANWARAWDGRSAEAPSSSPRSSANSSTPPRRRQDAATCQRLPEVFHLRSQNATSSAARRRRGPARRRYRRRHHLPSSLMSLFAQTAIEAAPPIPTTRTPSFTVRHQRRGREGDGERAPSPSPCRHWWSPASRIGTLITCRFPRRDCRLPFVSAVSRVRSRSRSRPAAAEVARPPKTRHALKVGVFDIVMSTKTGRPPRGRPGAEPPSVVEVERHRRAGSRPAPAARRPPACASSRRRFVADEPELANGGYRRPPRAWSARSTHLGAQHGHEQSASPSARPAEMVYRGAHRRTFHLRAERGR